MVPLLARAVREVFRRERFPERVLWWFAAEGMCEWYALLAAELGPYLDPERGPAQALLSEISAPLFARRHALLEARFDSVPVPGDGGTGLLMGALYRSASNADARWIFAACGGAPRAFAEHAVAERWLASMTPRDRWEEVTCHLGELLIALTERLPERVPRARGVLGDLCFAAGVRFGRKMKKAFALPGTPEDALELLRMSEYVFRVNPDHWGGHDGQARTGWLEGTACPWYDAPGWNGAHCGIFGQFQSGIASVCGLRYHLTTTIPRHGGHTCRIDLRQAPDVPAVALRRRAASAASSIEGPR
ncbi:MAG: hypothetical protein WKG00_35565 [Polyangiaceae bacterium]